jgi:hypothetical protein
VAHWQRDWSNRDSDLTHQLRCPPSLNSGSSARFLTSPILVTRDEVKKNTSRSPANLHDSSSRSHHEFTIPPKTKVSKKRGAFFTCTRRRCGPPWPVRRQRRRWSRRTCAAPRAPRWRRPPPVPAPRGSRCRLVDPLGRPLRPWDAANTTGANWQPSMRLSTRPEAVVVACCSGDSSLLF